MLNNLVKDFLSHVVECSYDCYESNEYTGIEIFKGYAKNDIDIYLFQLCYEIEGNIDIVDRMIQWGKICQDLKPYINGYFNKYIKDNTINNDLDDLRNLAITFDNMLEAACNEVMEKVWSNLGYDDIEEVCGKIPFTDKILDIINYEIENVTKTFMYFS